MDTAAVKLIEQTDSVAHVSAQVIYKLTQLDCGPVTYEILIRLIYDLPQAAWLFDAVESVSKIP